MCIYIYPYEVIIWYPWGIAFRTLAYIKSLDALVLYVKWHSICI